MVQEALQLRKSELARTRVRCEAVEGLEARRQSKAAAAEQRSDPACRLRPVQGCRYVCTDNANIAHQRACIDQDCSRRQADLLHYPLRLDSMLAERQ